MKFNLMTKAKAKKDGNELDIHGFYNFKGVFSKNKF